MNLYGTILVDDVSLEDPELGLYPILHNITKSSTILTPFGRIFQM